jgi:hypothetical protein
MFIFVSSIQSHTEDQIALKYTFFGLFVGSTACQRQAPAAFDMYQQAFSCPVHDNLVVIEAEIFMSFLQLVIL